MRTAEDELPIPALEPGPLTMDQYHAIPVEKFEFWDGYLFFPDDYPGPRRHLLAALLVNQGLLEAVKLAPEDRWRRALERVYGRAAAKVVTSRRRHRRRGSNQERPHGTESAAERVEYQT